MEKRYGFGLTAVVFSVAFMPFGCASSNMAKQKEALIEVHKPVTVEKTGKDNRPEWTTKESFIEEEGNLIYTGGVIGGADYALTLRLAKSEATKNLLESIQIKARGEFTSAIHGQNRSDNDLGRYVTDAVAWTVDNLKIQGIKQKGIYYEQIFDPADQAFKYNAWVQLQISKSDYLRAKTAAAEKLLNKAIREKDQEAKEKALELLEKLRQEA
jgi:hypothetical protein